MDDKSHKFAGELLEWIKSILRDLGIETGRVDEMEGIIYTVLIALFAWAVAWILRYVLHYVFLKILGKSKNEILRVLVDRRVFSGVAHVLPPLIMLSLLPLVYDDYRSLIGWVERFCWIYLVIAFLVYTNTFLSALWRIFSSSDAMKDRPLKGLIQLVKGILIGLGVIIVISILVQRSPMKLITGLGAFAAVLMLVFKDSILGFVAGVQLAQNDIVRKGDWIVMPGGMLNGVVIDITLNTVKVQNFDNTIVTVPPYSLISGTLQNWRGMAESGGRRIMRDFTIDVTSIKVCTPELLESLKSVDFLKSYIEEKQAEQAAGKVENTDNSNGLVNGTIETNLGLFRAYVAMYLRKHPFVNEDLTLMTRLLEPTENGIPFEIYCFSANKNWVSYESIQAEIMEHVAAVAARFELHIYQNASGHDYIVSAYITAGKEPPV